MRIFSLGEDIDALREAVRRFSISAGRAEKRASIRRGPINRFIEVSRFSLLFGGGGRLFRALTALACLSERGHLPRSISDTRASLVKNVCSGSKRRGAPLNFVYAPRLNSLVSRARGPAEARPSHPAAAAPLSSLPRAGFFLFAKLSRLAALTGSTKRFRLR